MAAIKIPEQVKADLPPTVWGKLLAATPVLMTVLATALAGLSSSEMTRAQYDRSLAAQLQSKAGDQWGLFQAKRLRSALQSNTLDLLGATVEIHPLSTADIDRLSPAGADAIGSSASLADLKAFVASPRGKELLADLQRDPVAPGAALAAYPKIHAAAAAMAASRPEPEITALVADVDDDSLRRALLDSLAAVQQFDHAVQPVEEGMAEFGSLLSRTRPLLSGSDAAAINRDFTALRLRHAGRRYDAEAKLNQTIATVYELQVRKANVSAERHHVRSQRFFYGMLGAQMAVIIATLALAARQRSLLWSLAAVAGLAALAFALYVYLVL